MLANKLSNRDKNFAPFVEFTESLGNQNEPKVDHFISTRFDVEDDNDSGEPAPVLGLNLREYFQKRHLVDQIPVEPLPPIENPLEMTQNHEDWVRGQEDFKIGLEQLQSLNLPRNVSGSGARAKSAFPSGLVSEDVDVPANVFNFPVPQKEMAAFKETIRNASTSGFVGDKTSWDALTQAHHRHAKIEELNQN